MLFMGEGVVRNGVWVTDCRGVRRWEVLERGVWFSCSSFLLDAQDDLLFLSLVLVMEVGRGGGR